MASLTAPLVLLALGQGVAAVLFALLTILLWVKHRENIARLRAGSESRIGAK